MILFNKKIKGGIYLLRHFVYSLIPIFLVFYFEISQTEPIKWVIVLPFMYLIGVNDYNRFFTLFKKPLPFFMILVLLSIICGMFPIKAFLLSILCIFFRIIMVFNITSIKKNN
jgi:hypothetical protein